MSKEIKEIQSDAHIVSNEISPRTGSFEITIDGELVYSKFKTNIFPSKSEIKRFFND